MKFTSVIDTRAAARVFVPDLTPEGQPKSIAFLPKLVFVAESPHVSEVSPPIEAERRPLCGKAGVAWWGALSEILEGKPAASLTRVWMVDFCNRHHLAVMNAVQYPLDPLASREVPEAEPSRTTGVSKAARADNYKRLKSNPEVQALLVSLRERLNHEGLAGCAVIPLGTDAEWFLKNAFSAEEYSRRVRKKLAHPSAWWRRGGLFGRQAREVLTELHQQGELN